MKMGNERVGRKACVKVNNGKRLSSKTRNGCMNNVKEDIGIVSNISR